MESIPIESLGTELKREDFEEVKNKYPSDLPSVTFLNNRRCINFNRAATELFGDNRYLGVYISSSYIVFVPRNTKGGGYTLTRRAYGSTITTTALAQYGLKPRKYALYKCRDGFAIKRYEPLA